MTAISATIDAPERFKRTEAAGRIFPGECARGVAEYMAECRKYGSITKCGLELAWSFRVHLLGMQDVDALNGK